MVNPYKSVSILNVNVISISIECMRISTHSWVWNSTKYEENVWQIGRGRVERTKGAHTNVCKMNRAFRSLSFEISRSIKYTELAIWIILVGCEKLCEKVQHTSFRITFLQLFSSTFWLLRANVRIISENTHTHTHTPLNIISWIILILLRLLFWK